MAEEKIGAVIVAAGKGERMGGSDKIFADLDGSPSIARVIDVFQRCSVIDEIVVVFSPENLEAGQKLVSEFGFSKVVALCAGGARRQDSVREGLMRLADCQWAIIHDGARPLLSADLIVRGLEEARQSGAAIAAVPVTDTVKTASPDGFVQNTPQRDTMWAVQTPQVFRFDLISRAHEEVTEDVTDDAMMLEKLGYRVMLYMGSPDNIKVTTPEDLALAEIILRSK